eukprot:1326265-Amphidinium_carterae.2
MKKEYKLALIKETAARILTCVGLNLKGIDQVCASLTGVFLHDFSLICCPRRCQRRLQRLWQHESNPVPSQPCRIIVPHDLHNANKTNTMLTWPLG